MQMEKFNLKNLGVNYTVLDQDTQKTDVICVINSDELRAVIGDVGLDEENVKQLLKGLKGFVRTPYDITWYAARRSDFELSSAIIRARKEGNSIVVTEVLPDYEPDVGFNIPIP